MAVLIEKYAAIDRSFFIFRRTVGISVEKLFSMFQFLQKKIEEGFGKQEFQQYMRREGLPLAFFRDEHLVDVWNRYDRPAYQKYGKRDSGDPIYCGKAGTYLEDIHTRSV